MSYEVSDIEKYNAEKAIQLFKQAYDILKSLDNEFNKILRPFKENPSISPEEIMKTRYFLREYRDEMADKLIKFKQVAFKCNQAMSMFAFDLNTTKLIKSFNSEIDVLENYMDDFKDLFNDLKDSKFTENIIKKSELFKKQADEILDLIDNRIKKHIKENILSYSWIDRYNKENKELTMQQRVPLLLQIENSQKQGK